MHICTVIELATKFITVIDSKVIGISRHKDYSLFHFKARDVKALKVPISKFIFVDANAVVDEVIPAEQLAARGVNYKTAKRDAAELTDVELAEVSGAVALACAAMESGLTPRPEPDTKSPVAHTPADGVPKVIITPGAAATGPGEPLTQAESTQAVGSGDAGEGETAVDVAAEGKAATGTDAAPADESTQAVGDVEAGEGDVAVEGGGDIAAEGEVAADAEVAAKVNADGDAAPDEPDDNDGAADEPTDDPLATVKPSRKKRRR